MGGLATDDYGQEVVGRFQQFAERRFGLHITDDEWPKIRRRLEKKLQPWMVRNGSGWIGELERLPPTQPEFNSVVESITVGETHFFRAESHFRALRALMAEQAGHSPGRRISLWSAGCSTGDEAYSMAIVGRELLGPSFEARADILATDICMRAVEIGREGVYDPDHLRECPEDLRARYFAREDGDRCRLHDSMRRLVRFQPLNLMADALPRDRDIIFCRHVSLYMTPASRIILWKRLAAVLSPEGRLFIADAETIDPGCGLVRDEVEGVRVFRRPPKSS